jgi:hypothetical protein
MGATIGGPFMSSPEPLAALRQAVGRYLIAVCPRNELTPNPAPPAVRMPPRIFCEACLELADVLGLEEQP